jgi:hypothetical protein
LYLVPCGSVRAQTARAQRYTIVHNDRWKSNRIESLRDCYGWDRQTHLSIAGLMLLKCDEVSSDSPTAEYTAP